MCVGDVDVVLEYIQQRTSQCNSRNERQRSTAPTLRRYVTRNEDSLDLADRRERLLVRCGRFHLRVMPRSPQPQPPSSPFPSCPSVSGNTAFVLRAPLGDRHGAAAAPRSLLTALSASSLTRSGRSHRTPWTCLAPGGKVGRQKVSLDRAVTSITTPKPEQKQEKEVI